MHRPVDLKSQNSDYGSFCTTPSDNFGLTRSSATASVGAAGGMSSRAQGGGAVDAGGGSAGSGGATGGKGEDHEQMDRGGEDSSVMANVSSNS
jgi:hypothetical protein